MICLFLVVMLPYSIKGACTDLIAGCNTCLNDHSCMECNQGYGLIFNSYIYNNICIKCTGALSYCQNNPFPFNSCLPANWRHDSTTQVCIKCTDPMCRWCYNDN